MNGSNILPKSSQARKKTASTTAPTGTTVDSLFGRTFVWGSESAQTLDFGENSPTVGAQSLAQKRSPIYVMITLDRA